jgi:hypothetical protein
MRRILMIGVLLVLFGAFVLPAYSAGGAWDAWLYDREFGRAVKVSHDGTSTITAMDFVLPGDPGVQYSSNIAVSYDGRLIAYTTSSPDGSTWRLRIYDTLTNTLTTNHPLPPNIYSGLDFHGSMYMFAPNGTTFVMGYSYFTDTGFGWTILIFDPLTGMNIDGIDSSSAAGTAYTSGIGGGLITPVVRYVSSGDAMASIYGTMVYTATEGSPSYPGFRWDVNAMNVVSDYRYFALDMDRSITSDMVLSTHDPGLPSAFTEMAGFAIPNALSGYDAVSGVLAPFAFTPGVFAPRFVQASERIAYRAFDVTSFEPLGIYIMERSGGFVGSLGSPTIIPSNVTSIDGTIGGFIFTASGGTGRAGGTTLYRVYTREGSSPYLTPESIWNSTLGANYVIAWISDEISGPVAAPAPWGTSAVALGEPPALPTLGFEIVPLPLTEIMPVFPTATPFVVVPPVITPPVIIPTVISPPVVIPTVVIAPPGLRIGGQARVQTTEGDPLNVRSGPGRSNPILGRANNGDIVTVLQGPVAADGFNWWQIQLRNGLVGWSVDFADGIATLIPI